jgi:ankyrin repeat protein
LQRDRLVNDPDRIITWCNNLVVMDEEDDLVQFAHHSVRQFLFSKPSDNATRRFHLRGPEVDIRAGHICVTYLNFNDFERQMTLHQKPSHPIQPKYIADVATMGSSRLTKYMERLASIKAGFRGASGSGQDISQLYQAFREGTAGPLDLVQSQYPFLAYAREFWLPHSAKLSPESSRSWSFWQKLINPENLLAIKPWINADGTFNKEVTKHYMVSERHLALAHYVEELGFEKPDLMEILLNAILRGYSDMVQLMLQNRIDIDAVGGYCDALCVHLRTPLELASERGNGQIMTILLNAGADVNASTVHFGSPLQAASTTGKEIIIKLLLQRGAKVNTRGGEYGLAIAGAIRYGHEGATRLLLKHGAAIHTKVDSKYGSPLQIAVEYGHTQIAKLLIRQEGADVNSLNQRGVRYSTPLQAASDRGNEEIVKLLLDKGASVDQEGPEGNALILASGSGHIAIVNMLLQKGADVHREGDKGSALVLASRNGHVAIVRILIDKGCRINTIGVGGMKWGTALQAASAHGQEEVVKLLLGKGAAVNQYGPRGNALQLAEQYGHDGTATLLIENGATSELILPQD